MFASNIESKAHLSQPKRPDEATLKKAGEVRLNVKVLLTIFIDYNGVVHHEFLAHLLRNTTLKLYADCMQQFGRNAQNCGKTNHE